MRTKAAKHFFVENGVILSMKRLFYHGAVVGTAIACLLAFTACGEQPEDNNDSKAFSPDSLIEDILSNVTFSGDLKKVDDESASFTFSFSEETEILLYRTDGYYADEFAVFTSDSASDADAVYDTVTAHVRDLKDSFTDYLPEEVPKIDDAIVEKYENYVILCITDDTDTAKDIIADYTD